MSNHIPDAGKMVCPKCGAEKAGEGERNKAIRFACDSVQWTDCVFDQSTTCSRRQRDQLRARVEGLEGWIRSRLEHAQKRYDEEQVDGDGISIASTRASYCAFRDVWDELRKTKEATR